MRDEGEQGVPCTCYVCLCMFPSMLYEFSSSLRETGNCVGGVKRLESRVSPRLQFDSGIYATISHGELNGELKSELPGKREKERKRM